MAGDIEGAGTGSAPHSPSFSDPLDQVAAAILEPEEDGRLTSLGAADPAPNAGLDGVRPGEWTPDALGLPPGCPVLPLGTDEGAFYFLDTIGQLRTMSGGDLGQAGINELFMGRHLWLTWAFPKTNRDGVVTSWRPERVRECLMAACARKGPWSPMNAVRGRGMWRDQRGRLILHCGDRLMTEHGLDLLGEHQGKVYPTRPPLPRPWPMRLMDKPGPARLLYPHFSSWNWARPQLDPVLLIGAIAVGYIGGALKNRPAWYALGDKATGKSALQEDFKALQGEWLVNTGDTTSAGLYQLLKHDCLPIAIDEFEAKADNRKQKAVVELMRLSYTGAPMNRGGDNHKGTQFHGRSAFGFSSINMPAMEPQDLSRLAILRLRKLKEGQSRPIIPEHRLAELGRQMLRRILDNWHRWDATLRAWRDFLASCGHDGRGQDTFGTLMAAADLVIAEDALELGLDMGPNADGEHPFNGWRDVLTASAMPEFMDANENWKNCLRHLLSKRIEAWRGGTRHTVGQMLTEFFEADFNDPDAIKFGGARTLLQQTGLSLLQAEPRKPVYELLVPNNHTALTELFKDSKWVGEMGSGSWSFALRQADDGIWREASGRIDGEKYKGVAFKLSDIIAKKDGVEE